MTSQLLADLAGEVECLSSGALITLERPPSEVGQSVSRPDEVLRRRARDLPDDFGSADSFQGGPITRRRLTGYQPTIELPDDSRLSRPACSSEHDELDRLAAFVTQAAEPIDELVHDL